MSNFSTFFPSGSGGSGGGGGSVSTNPKDLHRRLSPVSKLKTNNSTATGLAGADQLAWWTGGGWNLGSVTNCDYPRSQFIMPTANTWHTIKDLTTTNGGLLFNIVGPQHNNTNAVCDIKITVDGVESIITYGEAGQAGMYAALVLGGTFMGSPPGSSTTYSGTSVTERVGNPKQYGYQYSSQANTFGNGGLQLGATNFITIPDDSLLYNYIGYNETLKIEVRSTVVSTYLARAYVGCTVMSFDF